MSTGIIYFFFTGVQEITGQTFQFCNAECIVGHIGFNQRKILPHKAPELLRVFTWLDQLDQIGSGKCVILQKGLMQILRYSQFHQLMGVRGFHKVAQGEIISQKLKLRKGVLLTTL